MPEPHIIIGYFVLSMAVALAGGGLVAGIAMLVSEWRRNHGR